MGSFLLARNEPIVRSEHQTATVVKIESDLWMKHIRPLAKVINRKKQIDPMGLLFGRLAGDQLADTSDGFVGLGDGGHDNRSNDDGLNVNHGLIRFIGSIGVIEKTSALTPCPHLL